MSGTSDTLPTHILPPEDDVAWLQLQHAGGTFHEDDPASEAALLRARTAVRRAATTETLGDRVTRVRRRRARALVAGVGLVAAALAVGFLNVRVGGQDLTTPSASAAAVLERAAQAELAASDPVAAPGQFLRIRLQQTTWDSVEDTAGQVVTGADGEPAISQARWTRTLWIPADASQNWTVREHSSVLRSLTSDPTLQPRVEPTRTWREGSWSDPKSTRHLITYDPAWYASLPRDPKSLMKAVREAVGGEGSGTEYDSVESYGEVLRSGMAPADVRAALLRGLAGLPGMRVERDLALPGGRDGTSIGFGSGTRMVFDQASGRYLGEHHPGTFLRDVPGLGPIHSSLDSEVTTDVVDTAPPVDRP